MHERWVGVMIDTKIKACSQRYHLPPSDDESLLHPESKATVAITTLNIVQSITAQPLTPQPNNHHLAQ